MAIPNFPQAAAPELIDSMATVAYSDLNAAKAGENTLAKVMQSGPDKAQQVRRTLAMLSDQLKLPFNNSLVLQTGSGGGNVPPNVPRAVTSPAADPRKSAQFMKANTQMIRRVAGEVAQHLNAGKTPEQAVKMIVDSPMGKSLEQIAEGFRRAGFTHPVAGAGAKMITPQVGRVGAGLARVGKAGLRGALGTAGTAAALYAEMINRLNDAATVAEPGDMDSIITEFESLNRLTDMRDGKPPVIKPIGEQGGDLDVRVAAKLFSKTPGIQAALIERGLLSPESSKVVDDYMFKTSQEQKKLAEEFPESPVAPDEPSVSARPPAAEAPAAEGFEDMKARMMNEATQRQAAARQPGVLRVGSRGSAVGDLQTKLRALDTSEAMVKDRFGRPSLFDLGTTGAEGIGIDNVYGTKTRDAVRAFQKMAGITVDGRAGPETMEALDKAIEATKLARQEQMRQNREIAAAADDAPAAPAVPKPTEFTRVDESVFTDALTKDTDEVQGDIVEGLKTVDPTTSLMDTQEYLKLELDEEPRRRSAFPMPPRSQRNRRNRQ